MACIIEQFASATTAIIVILDELASDQSANLPGRQKLLALTTYSRARDVGRDARLLTRHNVNRTIADTDASAREWIENQAKK